MTRAESGKFICAICMEPLGSEVDEEFAHHFALGRCPDRLAIVSLHCGHVFHKICLEQSFWAIRAFGPNRKCPICRHKLRKKTRGPMIHLYPTMMDDQSQPQPPCDHCKLMEAEVINLRKENEKLRRERGQPSRDCDCEEVNNGNVRVAENRNRVVQVREGGSGAGGGGGCRGGNLMMTALATLAVITAVAFIHVKIAR